MATRLLMAELSRRGIGGSDELSLPRMNGTSRRPLGRTPMSRETPSICCPYCGSFSWISRLRDESGRLTQSCAACGREWDADSRVAPHPKENKVTVLLVAALVVPGATLLALLLYSSVASP